MPLRPFHRIPSPRIPNLLLAAPLLLTGLLLPDIPALPGGAVAAQTIPSPYRFVDDRHEAGIFVAAARENRGEMELGPGGGMLFGGRYSIELGGPFALEASSFLLPTDRKVRVPGDEGGIDDLGTADALVGAIDARVRFGLTGARTWHRLAPFVLAGGGVAGDFYGRSELEEELPREVSFRFGPSFLGVLGGGTRWLPAERITVRADVLLNIWKVGTPQAFLRRDDELGPIPQQEWTGVPAFSLGLSYRF
ncbi:MAG: hypothetical protein EA421_09245 [Gemmatimonadales bacterium]|nr:MAG: hypothetical protein EA421_09245 [Gemmatimonadales bacterium]